MAQVAAKLRFRPEFFIAFMLLLIPIGVAVYCFLPQYYSFTGLGKIVSVRDIGVEGSVNFCFIREGFTRNLYERWSVNRAYPDTHFELADASAKDYYSNIVEDGKQARNETIHNAITSANAQLDEAVTENEFDKKLGSLINETANYYGDSLGLMVGIGLVEEAQHEDFSKGGTFIIAGTGTMEADHSVGSVGGIRDKLLTAEKFGTDYFLVPKDKDNFPYEGLSNEEEAAKVTQELHLNLKVIPVATMEEALHFLRQLSPNAKEKNTP
jgi:Lon-like protease